MRQETILYPVMAMFLLTAAVWGLMYVLRIAFVRRNRIDLQSISTPEALNARIPGAANNASNNLKNLFELPVIFYVLCTLLLFLHQVDTVYLFSAWAYAGLRAVHSFIHCTVNIVSFRFVAYFLSSLFLWFMVIRLTVNLL